MHYVYLLQSEAAVDERYVGVTSDLKHPLAEHNAGKSPHTSKFTPWKLVTYVAFSDERKAENFERYLKSGSGRRARRLARDAQRHRSVVGDAVVVRS